MRFEIPAYEGRKACTISEKKVYLPNATVLGSSLHFAKPGNLVTFRTYEDGPLRMGRVLGRLEWPFDHAGHLVVLMLAENASSAFPVWVDPKLVTECRNNPSSFAAWFFQERLPNPDAIHALSAYGTLSEHFIAKPGTGPRDWQGKDGRAEFFGWNTANDATAKGGK